MRSIFFLPALLALAACQPELRQAQGGESADVILLNGNIYTVDEAQPTAEAVAIGGGRILKVGTNAEIEALRDDSTEVIDLQGRFAMPGFIEGHGHFNGLGKSLINLNFLQSKSWDEIVNMVGEKAKTAKPGEWIAGRGWHQEKWTTAPGRTVDGYPYHDLLSAVSPDNPVILFHASGHGLFANARAMELAGVTVETPDPTGGKIVRDSRGQAIGVFEERAMSLIGAAYNEYLQTLPAEERKNLWLKETRLAVQECLENGITSFQDAGSGFQDVEWYRELAGQGGLDLRLWVMVRESADRIRQEGGNLPVVGLGDHSFTCRAIKVSIDGALGSFGAWLLEPYEERSGFYGQNTTSLEELNKLAGVAVEKDMQLCVHAIGDRANREALDVFDSTFAANPGKEDFRWRIEHAQHLHPDDIPRFAGLGVIAAMQGIHCTSDAPFVVQRLGEQRAREGAYVWRSLLNAGAVVTNGTDAPVEDVDPIASFYATVTRKRADNPEPFFPEQALTRAEAIRSYTLANAYAAFEEDLKGSIAEGKLADIVVLSNDLINCAEKEILDTKVLMTMVGGKVRYGGM